MLSNQVRQTFIDYFARTGHRAVASSSLVPYGDNTILFTNAGMNQFKNAFLGLEKRDYTRAVTAQKVMRVSGKHNDLENVGPSTRHQTFFEMLGNFSFGDYFKDDAMTFALELLEREYGFERDRLWFTIYKDDDESLALWQKHGISSDRILRFGEKDNFWRMGPTGPCGPNSEIHVYTGSKKSDNLAKWVNNDDDPNETTVEIWNLVFMQFNQTEHALDPLPQTGVDTGMGFERLCRLLQRGENNYETDLFADIMERVQSLAGHTNAERAANYVPYRVIADHVRAASFLIGDGVLPGNEGRNYVLRMVMRRAMRFGRKIGFTDPFLHKVAGAVVEKMGGHYTELVQNRARIETTIHQEEERFERTLDLGLERLAQIVEASRKSPVDGAVTISGEDAFRLYDTLGLPIEITRDEARERGAIVDEAGYEAARERARETARAAGKAKFTANYDEGKVYGALAASLSDAGRVLSYAPYGALALETSVAAVLHEGDRVEVATEGDLVEVVLQHTPFYVESGGQVSDTGVITAAGDAWEVQVDGARRPLGANPGAPVVLSGRVVRGMLRSGDACVARVDAVRRADIERNHTATHLLQRCLRAVLGDHVGQQGSLVDEHRLRFDFSHGAALSADQLQRVSEMLNADILADRPVTDAQLPYADAIAGGAMAFFSEKYGDVVRVVSVGDAGAHPISQELCGGTHVRRTGEIGAAMVAAESAVSAGVRRIEVLTGRGALALASDQSRQLSDIARIVNAQGADIAAQTARLAEQLREMQKRLEQAQRELARIRFDEVIRNAQRVGSATVLVALVQADSTDQLREMSDWFREQHPSSVAVLAAVVQEKPALIAAASADLVKIGINAGTLIREIAAVVGGSGGGRPNMAQAGGRDVSKLDDALALARERISEKLK
jgi:alanyl-tRNA synthetase